MNATPWATEEKVAPWNEPSLSSWNSAQKPKTPITPGSGWNEGEVVDPSNWGHVSKMVGLSIFSYILISMSTDVFFKYIYVYLYIYL